jgi:hypothetical protein
VDRCDAYRHCAAKCVDLARTMDSPRNRSIVLEMARVWSRLAEYAAKTAAHKVCIHRQLTAGELSTLGEGRKPERVSGEA